LTQVINHQWFLLLSDVVTLQLHSLNDSNDSSNLDKTPQDQAVIVRIGFHAEIVTLKFSWKWQ